MADHPQSPSRDEMEAALRRLAEKIDFPEAKGLASSVRTTLEEGPLEVSRPSRRIRRGMLGTPSWATVVAAVVALVAGILFVSPAARTAVAELLGLGGIGIRFGESPPAPPEKSPDLRLGSRTTLEEARSRSAFEVLVPGLPEFAEPDEVYYLPDIPGGQVNLLYRPRADLPPTALPDIGMLLSQFPGSVSERDVIGKVIPSETRVESVTVGEVAGVWIEGEPHYHFYLDAEGNNRQESIRLAANTLIWVQGGITFRLESALPKERAIRIASSLR